MDLPAPSSVACATGGDRLNEVVTIHVHPCNLKTWYLIYKWTSVVCTVFLFTLCITGLPLIFPLCGPGKRALVESRAFHRAGARHTAEGGYP